MKKYNRETKKYEEEKPMTSLKKPETCKGKKPHDFVLLIPPYVSKHQPFTKDQIDTYYELGDRHEKLLEDLEKGYEEIGLGRIYRWGGETRRYYRCAVCGKERYN